MLRTDWHWPLLEAELELMTLVSGVVVVLCATLLAMFMPVTITDEVLLSYLKTDI